MNIARCHFALFSLAFMMTEPGLAQPKSGQQDGSTATAGATADGGFEAARPGPFERLETGLGVWTTNAGRAIVDDKHAKTGKNCLQLTGGERTTVSLKVAGGVDAVDILSFWAERWTVRKPFSFRIEKHTDKGWLEIYNGDGTVRVGREFLNHVQIPLADDGIDQLRFTCISPPDTGILLDDIRIAPARPQSIVRIEVEPTTLPALVGTDASPLVRLNVVTTGSLDPLAIDELKVKWHGSRDATDFTRLFVYPGRWDPEFARHPWVVAKASAGDTNAGGNTNAESNTAASVGLAASDGVFRYRPARPSPQPAKHGRLSEGENSVWVACRLKKDADIDGRIGVEIRDVRFSNGQTFAIDGPPSIQRLGVAVRQGGDDGIHTYRIPGLATTAKGSLIGVYDVRVRNGRDLPADIDVGMSRSTDGGRTWEPMKVIMNMGDDPKWHYDGVGDPAVLVDRNTGTIWVAAVWSHGNRGWHGSGPGLEPDETGQLMLVRSDDDGVTWSRPINITRQVKRPEWCFLLQGPGKGITMRDGTLVFAAQFQDPVQERRLPHSTIIYSKDHGETWQAGTGAFDDTTEAQVVEVEPGVLMLNCRYNRRSVRVVMTTRDMGRTWQQHSSSERALIEPGACMASLIDVDREVGQDVGGWLLFSNPDSTRGRHHITIKASSDRGRTWPQTHQCLLDAGASAGYSCMTMIDKHTVGILYEGSRAHMTFQRVRLNDLLGSPTK